LKNLSDSEKGQLLDAIFIYEIEKREIVLSPALKMAFEFIKKDLNAKYAKKQAKIV
jgi:type IV secretory pathway VirB4 component